MRPLIIDTGFLVALLSRRDKNHEKAKEVSKKNEGRSWITTWPVLTEVSHLVDGHIILSLLRAQEKGLFQLFPLEEEHLPRIAALLEKYHTLPLDFADASLVILAEELESGDILSTDRKDFASIRWKGKRIFNNLLVNGCGAC